VLLFTVGMGWFCWQSFEDNPMTCFLSSVLGQDCQPIVFTTLQKIGVFAVGFIVPVLMVFFIVGLTLFGSSAKHPVQG